MYWNIEQNRADITFELVGEIYRVAPKK